MSILRLTELAELHERDTQDLYALLEDAHDGDSIDCGGGGLCFPRGLGSLDRIESGDPSGASDPLYMRLISKCSRLRWQRFERLTVGIILSTLPILDYGILAPQCYYSAAVRFWGCDTSHSSHGDDRRNVQTARPCYYADFMKCQPLNFKGTEGVVGLTRWIEKIESDFNISGYAIENQVKFATCTLLGAALTWWNGQIRTLGPEAYAMTWEGLKKKMTDKYYPLGEIQKLKIELWNLKVKGNDINKYIRGLPDNIYGNVKSSKPKTLDETIELANDLMVQKLHTYAEKSYNKRKADDSSRNNHGHQQQPFKKQNVSKSTGNTNVANTQKGNGAAPKRNGCFKCEAPGHFKRDCPKLKNKDGWNGNAQGWVYAVGNVEKKGNASGKGTQTLISSW
ncbi:putative reverse transcriptase domain-containing protein, partial [Tanacetum coccineum]